MVLHPGWLINIGALAVNAGDTISFGGGRGNGNFSFDTTSLAATIRLHRDHRGGARAGHHNPRRPQGDGRVRCLARKTRLNRDRKSAVAVEGLTE
jgi:hypothetical protein